MNTTQIRICLGFIIKRTSFRATVGIHLFHTGKSTAVVTNINNKKTHLIYIFTLTQGHSFLEAIVNVISDMLFLL